MMGPSIRKSLRPRRVDRLDHSRVIRPHRAETSFRRRSQYLAGAVDEAARQVLYELDPRANGTGPLGNYNRGPSCKGNAYTLAASSHVTAREF